MLFTTTTSVIVTYVKQEMWLKVESSAPVSIDSLNLFINIVQLFYIFIENIGWVEIVLNKSWFYSSHIWGLLMRDIDKFDQIYLSHSGNCKNY